MTSSWNRLLLRFASRQTMRTAGSRCGVIMGESSRPASRLWSERQVSSSSSSSSNTDRVWWSLRQPKPGSGFDNFFPKGKKNDSDSENDKSSSSFGDAKHESQGDNNNNNNKNGGGGPLWDWTNVALMTLLAALFLFRSSDRHDETTPNDSLAATADSGHMNRTTELVSRTITWHDFLQLLQQRDVVKIVVSMGGDPTEKTARVYVRPNATGLARTSNVNVNSSYEERRLRLLQQQTAAATTGTDDPAANRTSSSGFSTTTILSSDDHPHAHDHMILTRTGGTASTTFPTTTAAASGIAYRLQIGSRFERKLEEVQRALGQNMVDDVPVQYTESTTSRELASLLPSLLIAAVLYGLLRMAAGGVGAGSAGGRGGMGSIFQIGKSTAKKIAKEDVKITFADVAGCEEAKLEIMEFVDFLEDPTRFTKLGAKIPKGALLCGPPGTGKTLLARAVAGEAGVPFYSISGSDFIEMFVGVGPSRVRDLFKEARENAPCIVFIDEIDAVGRQRGRGGLGGNDERENTLNQLLVEMDGFSPSTGVVVLAGTNRVDILDQALTRPGRFDRQIVIDKPDLKGRKAIFKVHLKGIKLQDEVGDIAGRLAGLTPGFAGADISNICNEAAIVAARRKGETVTLDDFEKATDRIVGGLESNKIMSKEERSIVATHEAGHAVSGWFLEHADPLLKVTIIPRASGALGYAQYLPKEVFLRTKLQIMDVVCMALAGRAAEEIVFGRVTTGASDDLRRVTEIVYSTIQLYGMNSRLGQLSFPKDPNAWFDDRPYSEKTAKAMDEEARTTVDDAYQRTLNLLRDKRHELDTVASLLLEKETITHEDMIASIGPRPFKGDPGYEEYLARRKQDKEAHSHDQKEETATSDEDSSSSSAEAPLNPGLA